MYKLCNEHTPFWGRWMAFWSTLLYPGGAQYATEPSPVFWCGVNKERGTRPPPHWHQVRITWELFSHAAWRIVWPRLIVQSDLTQPVGEHFCFYAFQTNHREAVGSFGCQHAGCPSVSPSTILHCWCKSTDDSLNTGLFVYDAFQSILDRCRWVLQQLGPTVFILPRLSVCVCLLN